MAPINQPNVTKALGMGTDAANQPATQAQIEAAGLAGRLFVALDANGNGRLEIAELPKGAPLLSTANTAKAVASIGLADFTALLDRWPIEDAGKLARSDGKVARPPRDAPIHRPQLDAYRKAPKWFAERDKNGDGQLDLSEWPVVELDRFRALDVNGDGLLTATEAK